MAKTLASCRRSSPERRAQSPRWRGFTLLELLVVLALVALVTGLVAPVAYKGLSAARERGALADLSALLEGLPMRAFRSGAAQSYDGRVLASLLPELPAGWRVVTEPELRYAASGVAGGGVVRLLNADALLAELRVLAVSGEVAGPQARP